MANPLRRLISSERDVYIVDGNRTPFLKTRNVPGPFSASDLAVMAGRTLLLRQPFSPEELDEVIVGCVMPSPDEANIGRVISLRLGCGKKVPAWTVQRNCASGLQAIDCAYHNIAMGKSDLVLAGGTEAMSRAPLLFSIQFLTWLGNFRDKKSLKLKLKQFLSLRPAYLKPVIALLRGLVDPVVGMSMGQTAEELAYQFNISREAMDQFAVQSNLRAAKAQSEGLYQEITAIIDSEGTVFDKDNGVRPDSTVEKLATLKPYFDKLFGKVTAGNSSQITDGAAFVLLASKDAVDRYQLPVIAKIVDSEWAGVAPEVMGLGPVHATTPILERNKLSLSDIDYWEINEAFAAQVIACLEAWKSDEYCKTHLGLKQAMGLIDQNRLNVDGGAISIGHPVGASGARLVLHLTHVLQRNNAKRGIATLCIGGGQGGSMLIERVDGVKA